MTLAENPQHSFEEIPVVDHLDGEKVEELLGAIQTWTQNKDAAARFNKATRTIKELSVSPKDYRYPFMGER